MNETPQVPMDRQSTDRQWYALQVRLGFEKIVALHLENKGYEHYLPTYRRRRRSSDGVKEIELPLFPGHVFCKFEMFRRLPIMMVPGVLSVVGFGKNAFAVSDDEIVAVQNIVRSGLPYKPSKFIGVGPMVRMERGPLQGLTGMISATKKDCCLIISMNLLRRSVSIEVEMDSLTPISQADACQVSHHSSFRSHGGDSRPITFKTEIREMPGAISLLVFGNPAE